jgi:hypothetical protein
LASTKLDTIAKDSKVAVYLEQNIQDRDLEVKFEAVGSSVGLKTLKVVAQAGNPAPDA